MSKMCALVGAVARPESVYAKTAVKSESVYVNPTAVRYVRPLERTFTRLFCE
jgi:hypothetical protein